MQMFMLGSGSYDLRANRIEVDNWGFQCEISVYFYVALIFYMLHEPCNLMNQNQTLKKVFSSPAAAAADNNKLHPDKFHRELFSSAAYQQYVA